MEDQIIGSDGRLYVGEDAGAYSLVQGIEDGYIAGDEIIGQAPRFLGSPRVNPALRQRLAAALAQRAGALGGFRPQLAAFQTGPRVVPAGQGPIREVVQGLYTASVATGATADIQFNATMLFRPTRLMVGGSFAPFFVISDIKVGADSLFLSTGPVPAEAFLPDAVTASALKRRSASPGTPIIVSVQNTDGAAHPFRGALFGEASDVSACG